MITPTRLRKSGGTLYAKVPPEIVEIKKYKDGGLANIDWGDAIETTDDTTEKD